MKCSELVLVAEHIRGTNPVQNTDASIDEALSVIDCCRQLQRFDLAAEVLRMLDEIPAAKGGRNSPRVKKQRDLVESRCDVAEIVQPESEPSTSDPIEPPPKIIQGLNFARAMLKWGLSGFATRTEAEIEQRLKICQACPLYDAAQKQCMKCGCACNEKEQLLNKLSLATEVCPMGYWS